MCIWMGCEEELKEAFKGCCWSFIHSSIRAFNHLTKRPPVSINLLIIPCNCWGHWGHTHHPKPEWKAVGEMRGNLLHLKSGKDFEFSKFSNLATLLTNNIWLQICTFTHHHDDKLLFVRCQQQQQGRHTEPKSQNRIDHWLWWGGNLEICKWLLAFDPE